MTFQSRASLTKTSRAFHLSISLRIEISLQLDNVHRTRTSVTTVHAIQFRKSDEVDLCRINLILKWITRGYPHWQSFCKRRVISRIWTRALFKLMMSKSTLHSHDYFWIFIWIDWIDISLRRSSTWTTYLFFFPRTRRVFVAFSSEHEFFSCTNRYNTVSTLTPRWSL